MEKIVALAKEQRICISGFRKFTEVLQIHGITVLSVLNSKNVKRHGGKKFVQESKFNVGLDAAILMNPRTWEASGHVGGFADPLIDCKECKARFRADKLIEDYMQQQGMEVVPVDGWSNEKLEGYIAEKGIVCPECGKSNFTGIRQFNLMFKTFQGVTEDSKSELLFKTGNRSGYFRQFQKCAENGKKENSVRYCPDR